MTTTRILPGLVLLAATAGPASAQVMPPYTPPGRSPGVVPSVLPTGAGQPEAPAPRAATSLEKMTLPTPPGGPGVSDPVGTLNGAPAIPAGPPGLPPGTYSSPWYTDGPGCCGPLGRDGRVGYELYTYTGPNFVGGTGPFTDHLETGWMVGGGGRTLFFNRTHEAAWVIDIGLSYTYNRGDMDPVDLFIRQPPLTRTDPFTGMTTSTPQPDRLVTSAIRGLHRTSFNFALGRDWWLWGPGAAGFEHGWNARVGTFVGGRWGTMHVDVVPLDVPEGYARRQKVFHGVFLGGHANVEVPMGGWIWFGGLNVHWGYDWTDVVPPLNGDIVNVNLLLTSGIRF